MGKDVFLKWASGGVEGELTKRELSEREERE